MSGWRKRTIVEMAREAGFEQAGHASFQELTARMEAFAKLVREDERDELRDKLFKLTVKYEQINDELTAVYGLLGMAHLNIKQHLKYGFDEKTAQSTLISVGRYYPRLKIQMEKNNAS